MIDRDQLKLQIKELIVSGLDIDYVAANEIPDDVPLFSPQNPLGLDSIDAIEIVVRIEKKYKVRIGVENNARSVLESINTIADFLILTGKTNNINYK